MADWTSSQSDLYNDGASFNLMGFTDFVSWQYATDACQVTYSNARTLVQYLDTNGVHVRNFDKYTGGDPSWICQ